MTRKPLGSNQHVLHKLKKKQRLRTLANKRAQQQIEQCAVSVGAAEQASKVNKPGNVNSRLGCITTEIAAVREIAYVIAPERKLLNLVNILKEVAR